MAAEWHHFKRIAHGFIPCSQSSSTCLHSKSAPGANLRLILRTARLTNGKVRSGSWVTSKDILQSDGYAAYDHVGGCKIVHAGCWAHARRKFFQAVELNPQDQTAIGIVAQMDELSEIDEKASRGLKPRGAS
jgi:Transposase IS66 family